MMETTSQGCPATDATTGRATPDAAADREYLTIMRYRECDEILRRSREFVVADAKPESINFLGGTIVTLDGSEHLTRRRMFAKMIDIDQPWGPRGTLLGETFDRNLEELRPTLPADARFDLIPF